MGVAARQAKKKKLKKKMKRWGKKITDFSQYREAPENMKECEGDIALP